VQAQQQLNTRTKNIRDMKIASQKMKMYELNGIMDC
jgi:hypothetical protein